MRIRTLVVALAALAAALAPGAGSAAGVKAARIAAVGTGAIVSPNVSLVANFPDPGMTGGRFASGYFFTTISSQAFFEPGPNSGFKIYNVANPDLPVPVGFLPLPHAENEDVDISVSRKLGLVSMDTIKESFGEEAPAAAPAVADKLYVVSWENPRLPMLVGTLALPAKSTHEAGGPGHITNCIHDCKRYAWVSGAGDGSIYVVDLIDPSNPSIAAIHSGRTIGVGQVHDVNIDRQGYAWLTGRGGTVMMDVRNPLRPRRLKWISSFQNSRWNQFIHHNSLRLDHTTVLITEEDWLQPECGKSRIQVGDRSMGGGEQGGFQTWWIDPRRNGDGTVRHLDQWVTEIYDYGKGSAPTIVCSSHWFTYNPNRVVSVAWYNQGVRFLDVRNPRNIRQIGYWLGPGATASAAYFVPGRADLVYVTDYGRGLDVLRIADGGRNAPTVVAPMRAEWFLPQPVAFEPSPDWGYACLVARRPGA